MKWIYPLLFIAIVLFLSSCTVPLQIVTKPYLDSTISEIKSDLSDYGYELSGKSNDSKNEVTVSGVSYSTCSGYGTAMENNYWQYNEYTFVDSLDNSVSFTLKYRMRADDAGQEYLHSIEMTNCSSNKAYNTVCGNDGIVKGKIDNMINNPDGTIEVVDNSKTLLGVAYGTLGASLLVLLLVFLL